MRLLSSIALRWRARFIASAIHLTLSLCFALFSALLVFGLWYPYPYREISGGRELFILIVSVDVILGPLMTLAVFNREKPRTELCRDLAIIGIFQFVALAYGLWTVAIARPVHMVFEIDRFRVVHSIDIDPAALSKTPAGINALPLTGPTLLGLRPFKDSQENLNATMAAVQGMQLGSRPELWQPYAKSVPDILQAAKSVSLLKRRFPHHSTEIDQVLFEAGHTDQNTLYLPLVGRKSFWTVFLDSKTAQVLATMPLDSF
jgi:hypothetical protein